MLGGSALAFHVSSLLWYVALVLAGWAFARRCIGNGAAFAAMAVFVVMPVHVESAASAAARADTLGLLFGLLACLAVSPTVVDGMPSSWLRLTAAACAFIGALLSKESLAVLPLGLSEFRRRGSDRISFLRAHAPSLVSAVILACYAVLRLQLQPKSFLTMNPMTSWWEPTFGRPWPLDWKRWGGTHISSSSPSGSAADGDMPRSFSLPIFRCWP